MQEKSRNSLIASSGYKAEDIFRTDNGIKIRLEGFFGKKISSINKIHGKK